MPDGDFRLGLRNSTAVGVVEAVMKPAVIVAEVFADVVRGTLLAVGYVAQGTARAVRGLVKPVLYVAAGASLLAVGAVGGYGFRTYQSLPVRAATAAPVVTAPHPDLPDALPPAPEAQGEQNRPFGPRVIPPPADPFGMR